jgi:methylglutaconyl-CoA hydratase
VDLVLYQIEDGIARITLNRPEKRNALNREMITAFDAALRRAEADQQARVILITGEGKDFCAGLDLLALDRGNDAAITDHLAAARHLANLLLAIRRHKLPVIAAVHGRALGGGAGIATASDQVVISESGAIGYPEINIGYVPAIVAAFLRRSVPEKRLFEILALGQTLTAPEALQMGLVNRLFPEAVFAGNASQYARGLAAKSTSALTLLKNLLNQTDALTLEKAIETGIHVNALARVTGDAQRGFAGFLAQKT